MDRKAENFEIIDDDEDEMSEEIIVLSEKDDNSKDKNEDPIDDRKDNNEENKEFIPPVINANEFISPVDNSNFNDKQVQRHKSKSLDIQEPGGLNKIDGKPIEGEGFESEREKKKKISNKQIKEVNIQTGKPIEEEKPEPIVKMKDKKILVSVEELESEFKKKEKRLFGTIKCSNENEIGVLKDEVKNMHPRDLSSKKLKPHPLCQKMGNFGCYSEKVNNEICDLGVGIISYFKVLKVLIYCFFIISILNIPLYYVYTTNNTEIKSTGYRDLLFKTTIGNIASSICF
jgi:hypothetical protein